MVDNHGLGDIMSHQAEANFNIRIIDARDLEKQKTNDQEQKKEATETDKVQRQERLEQEEKLSSEKIELERDKTPQNDEVEKKRGEDGFRLEDHEEGFDVTA